MPADVTTLLGADAATGISETHWTSLRYFNLYRFILAGLLFVASVGVPMPNSVFVATLSWVHVLATGSYLLVTGVSVMSLHRLRRHFNLQLSLQVLVDIAIFTALMYAGGGLRSGFGVLLLVSLAGAGLVGQGRLVLFYAATATLAVLGSEAYHAFADEESGAFFQAGLLCIGFFATAISARLLARRLLANEELARQRGIALENQRLISQRVIEEMQDGVLVVSQAGGVRQHNPRAEVLLGRNASETSLAACAPALADGFRAWQRGGPAAPAPFRVAGSGLTLRARFVATESGAHDVLVFLEDMGRVQQHAQQLKLAALGRLTANIAHEIRNPLSAISHAGELLQEERRGEPHDRLLAIVRDNTLRLDRIVRDVLELGRRDRVRREPIDLAAFCPGFLEEFAVKERIAADLVVAELAPGCEICFDRAHLHQVLWNLLGNALRHCRRQPGSIRLGVGRGGAGAVQLEICDDGEGVPPEVREHVFEPFFTTHSRGTGLGLYIARELCEANGARLELLDNAPGGHFRMTGGSICDTQQE